MKITVDHNFLVIRRNLCDQGVLLSFLLEDLVVRVRRRLQSLPSPPDLLDSRRIPGFLKF